MIPRLKVSAQESLKGLFSLFDLLFHFGYAISLCQGLQKWKPNIIIPGGKMEDEGSLGI